MTTGAGQDVKEETEGAEGVVEEILTIVEGLARTNIMIAMVDKEVS